MVKLSNPEFIPIKPYSINLGKGGELSQEGPITTTEQDIDAIIQRMEEFFNEQDENQQPKRVLFYCHGGLVDQVDGGRLTLHHFPTMLNNRIYPVYFIWESGLKSILADLYQQIQTEFQHYNLFDEIAAKSEHDSCEIDTFSDIYRVSRPQSIDDIIQEVHASMDEQSPREMTFMAASAPSFGRLGHFVQELANKIHDRTEAIPGKLEDITAKVVQHISRNFNVFGRKIPDVWTEMKEKGSQVFEETSGGGYFLSKFMDKFRGQDVEVHLVGHSAGSIVLSTLLDRLNQKDKVLQGLNIKSCTLMAAACTEALFNKNYVPAYKHGIIENFYFYTLNEDLEEADICIEFLYRKSLLYAISECLEPCSSNERIIGMGLYAKENRFFDQLSDHKNVWVISNGEESTPKQVTVDHGKVISLISKNKKHGGFGKDIDTMNSVIKSIIGRENINPFSPAK